MNAKQYFIWALVALHLHAVAAPDLSKINNWLQDPLAVTPDRLSKGINVLPDDSVVSCPVALSSDEVLSLKNAVDVALCNHPEVQAAWAQMKIQSNALGEAKAAYLPTISGSVSHLNNTTVYPSSSGFPESKTEGDQAYFSLNWRLFDFGGGKQANKEAAQQLLNSALFGHNVALQKVMLSVVQSYFEAVTAYAAYQSRQEVTKLSEKTLSVAQERENKGASTLADTVQATTGLARNKVSEAKAKGDYEKALSVLKQAMAIAQETTIRLAMTIDEFKDVDLEDLNQWLAGVEKTHPLILQARSKLESDKAKVTVARSDGLPNLNGTAYISHNGYPNQGLGSSQTVYSVGVSVNIPIFEGFGRNYKVRGAQAQVEQSEAQLQSTVQGVLTEVVKAHADAKTAWGVLQASERLLNASREGVSSSERRYEKNVADILEVLNSQSSLADSAQEYIRSMAEWQSARLRLLANAGVLGQVIGKTKVSAPVAPLTPAQPNESKSAETEGASADEAAPTAPVEQVPSPTEMLAPTTESKPSEIAPAAVATPALQAPVPIQAPASEKETPAATTTEIKVPVFEKETPAAVETPALQEVTPALATQAVPEPAKAEPKPKLWAPVEDAKPVTR